MEQAVREGMVTVREVVVRDQVSVLQSAIIHRLYSRGGLLKLYIDCTEK